MDTNYAIKEDDKGLVLVNLNTKTAAFKVVGVNPETKHLELHPITICGVYDLPFDRINNIDTELLKSHFPECYI